MDDIKPLTGLPLFFAAIAVALATFLLVLDYSIANVSIPYISGDLAVSSDEGTYVITSFAVGNAIVLAISGWLSKRIGNVRLMVFSILGFTFLSWVCGMARDINTLVVARFLQGVVAGPIIPISQTLIIHIFPSNKQGTAIGFWSTVIIVAPILGPVLGGWLSYNYSWPWIFFINIPFGIFSALTIRILLKRYETPSQKIYLDWVGLLLLAISVTSLQFLLDKGEQYDWLNSNIILTCILLSFTGFTFLFVWEWLHPKPLLDLHLFKVKSYALSVFLIGISYSMYFGTVVLIPLWLQTYMKYTAIWAGVAVAPLGVMSILFSTSIGKLIAKVGPLIPLALSFIMFALSSFETAYLSIHVDIWHIAFSRFLLGFGLLFLIIPLTHLQVQDLPKDKLASGAGMFHFVRAMAGGVGTSVFTTLWIRRSAFHHSNLVFQIGYHPPFHFFMDKLRLLNIEGAKSWELINQMINNQAAVLGINDAFYFMGWSFLFLLPLLLIGMKSSKPYYPK